MCRKRVASSLQLLCKADYQHLLAAAQAALR